MSKQIFIEVVPAEESPTGQEMTYVDWNDQNISPPEILSILQTAGIILTVTLVSTTLQQQMMVQQRGIPDRPDFMKGRKR